MKSLKSKLFLALFVLGASSFQVNAQLGGQLGNLKNKVNKGSKDDSDKKDEGNKSDKNSVGAGLTCDELAEKADALYNEDNYTEAWKYYEQAEKDGCVAYMDGQTRMNMNSCKQEVNTTDEEKEKQQKFLDGVLGDIEDQKYKREKEEDNGIVGDVHKNNVNKIVFSKTEIVKGSENPSTFANSFTLADNIYSRVYIEQSTANFSNDIGAFPYTSDYLYRITIEGHTIPEVIGNTIACTLTNDGFKKWTTFQIAVSPTKADCAEYPSNEFGRFWEALYHLPAGSHKVKVEYVFDIPEDEKPAGSRDEQNCRKFTTKFGEEKVLATGEFTLNVKETDKLAFSEKLSTGLPKANMSNPTLEKSIISLTTGKWEKQVPMKALITSNDWIYHKNIYGVITHRSIHAAVVIKFEEDGIYEVFHMSFAEQAQEPGKYGTLYFDGSLVSEGDYIIAKEFVK